ncbi:hypothetical protein Hdeb2414_s0020g00553021 [Helianthus debilis subsp. tardiflorus]
MPFDESRVRARRERGAGVSLEERKSGKVFGWRPQRKGSPARFLVGDQRYGRLGFQADFLRWRREQNRRRLGFRLPLFIAHAFFFLVDRLL